MIYYVSLTMPTTEKKRTIIVKVAVTVKLPDCYYRSNAGHNINVSLSASVEQSLRLGYGCVFLINNSNRICNVTVTGNCATTACTMTVTIKATLLSSITFSVKITEILKV